MNDDPGEERVIGQVLAATRRTPAWLGVGPGDDAAVVDGDRVLATDAMIEGVHWDGRLGDADVGWKLAVANASDVAACGARPTWAMLVLALPGPPDHGWVREFSRGLSEGLDHAGAVLVGGDTCRSPGPRIAVLAMGGRLNAPPLLRSGARPGDDIWVSGTLGDAAAGFRLPDPPPELAAALARPRPPLALGPALAEAGLATAALDLSDGLGRDLPRLCEASGLGAVVQPGLLPASPGLSALGGDPLPDQVGFGEDYELLFTARPSRRGAIRALAASLGLLLSRIGRVTRRPGVSLAGRSWPRSWRHFEEAG